MAVARSLLDDLLDALLPSRCPGCGCRGALVCASCRATLLGAPPAPAPPPIEWWSACFAYEGVARELVARAKYRNERRFLTLVAREVARTVGAAPGRVDMVSWAPASAQRIRTHGVDHGELLARRVARIVGAPAVQLLRRGPGVPQTGLDAHARRHGPPLRAIGPVPQVGRVAGATILVVDDVATTGGTLAAAARALRDAGAGRVFTATIARTPRPGARSGVPAYTPATPASR